MEKKKSKVLIIGGTGRLGFHLAQLSLQSSHPTFVLIRDSSSVSSSSSSDDPTRQQKIHSLSTAGATLLKGSLEDEKSLVEAVKQVDVVICAIPSKQVLHQKLLIRAIKQVDVVICAITSKQVLHQKLLIRAIKQVGCIKVGIDGMSFRFVEKCALRRGLCP